jgi:hypothetical protein
MNYKRNIGVRDPEPVCREMVEIIDRFFASSRTDEENLQAANDALKELAYLNRRMKENRGIGKDSELSIPQWPVRIPLYIKKKIARGNEEAILELLEIEERRSNGTENYSGF